MIEALLGRIEGFFDKGFLFASLLPALIFLVSLSATLATIIGFDILLAWTNGLTTTEKSVISAVAMVGVVVFAYVLNGLRTSFVRLWSGLFAFPLLNPFLRFGEHLERGRYLKMKEIADRPSKKWDELFQWFRNEVSPHWNRDKPHIDEHNHQKLKTKVVSLRQEMSREEIKSILTAVIDAHKHYHGDSLGEIYKKVKDKLDYWYEQERGEIAGALSTLGQQFGTISSIRATALGNVVESYSVYPYRCYGMEHAEVLWPRLQYVIKPAFLTTIQEPRILLDFCLASATLSSFFGLLALIGGPWLWLNGWFWGILTLMAFFISYFFYRVGVFVATQYGEIVSASFDLFRLDLLSILHRACRKIAVDLTA